MKRTGLILIRADGTQIDDLRLKLVSLNDRAKAIQGKADAEKRSLTADESKEVADVFASFEATEAEIGRLEKLAAINARATAIQPRVVRPEPTLGIEPAREPKGQNGFRSLGEFAHVVRASIIGRGIDPRLVPQGAAPSNYGSEGTNADGGYAVPPDFRDGIVKLLDAEEALLPRTDQQITTSNAITFPVDLNSAWDTGGVRAYWENEAGQHTTSKPAIESVTVRANKLSTLVPVTDELLQDVPSMSSYLTAKAAEKMTFEINDAIVVGSGVGRPQGLLNAPCLVSVAKESAQTAATVNFQNIIKMWARLYAPCRSRAIWLINQDVEQQLQAMTFPTAAGTAVAPYMPPGGVSGAPYATIFGRPIVVVESCKALGTQGDIFLVDLSKYMTVQKAGGVRSDVSMHLWFDYDITAFRFVIRLGGQSWWRAAIARKNGSNTLSPIVTLDTRA